MAAPVVPLDPATWTGYTERDHRVYRAKCALCRTPTYLLPVKALAVDWCRSHNQWHRSLGH